MRAPGGGRREAIERAGRQGKVGAGAPWEESPGSGGKAAGLTAGRERCATGTARLREGRRGLKAAISSRDLVERLGASG